MSFRLPDLLRDHARVRPEACAVICGERRVTFGELDARTNRLAHALLAAGVGPGTRVAHLDQNAMENIELFFASAKIGAVFVPLNWRLAVPELEEVMADAGATLLVSGPDFAGTVAAPLEIVAGPQYEAWIAAHDATDSGRRGGSDDVVLQLYTSGTTGQPKGVLLTNANLEARTRISARWQVDPTSVSLLATPLFHIGGIGWFVVSFATGACTVMIRQVVPADLLDTMERERVTNSFLVPTILQMLCAQPGAAERDWSALRSIAYGASSITTPVLQQALDTFGCPLFQVYGLTESTGTVVQLDAEDHHGHLLRSAGKPFDWIDLKVIDPDSNAECAPGAVGEVCVRGASVMAGYHGKPEETAAVLRDGWLHTGDGGYLDEAGYLFLTDRIKDMIVTGAENVYPIEVEDVLAAHPAVGEVAVIGIPDPKWGEIVTAVVVPRGEDCDADALVAFARERLAGYKLPRVVHLAEALPKTASGKILKRALRDTYAA